MSRSCHAIDITRSLLGFNISPVVLAKKTDECDGRAKQAAACRVKRGYSACVRQALQSKQLDNAPDAAG